MILDELKLHQVFNSTWLERLRNGHFVWLSKEQEFAKVEFAWEPPEPGCRGGRIGIRRLWRDGDEWGVKELQTWYVTPGGKGFDGDFLLQPVVGNMPEEAAPISEPWQRHVERQLSRMQQQIDQIAERDKPNWMRFPGSGV